MLEPGARQVRAPKAGRMALDAAGPVQKAVDHARRTPDMVRRPMPENVEALARERFTGVTKVARDLGLGERTIRNAVERGDLPSYVFGQRVRIRVVDVRGWLDRCRQRPR
jgi:excisionase family DNA binding protein